MHSATRVPALFRCNGGDTIMEGDDVMTAIQALRNYFQPDTIDHIFKQVGKFTPYNRTDQSIGKF